uniref:EF-hand domain-containing protein n=1 Tax=Electrophorus electricus TaxID=8005 RepID=A0AAY5EVX8_ELEEL
KNLERTGSGLAPVAMLEKIQELFQICDSDDKGYITRTDMKKLHGEMPLTAEELENVFNSLDSDKNGCLTLEEFSLGFSELMADLSQNVPEVLYQDEPQAGIEDEEEKHFSLLMERLDACSVFKDYSEVRSLWAQLQKDEPHLLSNFEEFLAQVTSQIRQERKEMEDALRIKAATHDGEIRQLYEEMEQQINTEKDQLLLKGSERIQQWSQDLEQQLSCKEQELEQLGLRHRRLEKQCQELHSEHQESRVENNKLKMTNEELSHELENTCHELSLAQEQLAILEEQAVRLQQEREMEIYRITEGLQREKQSLIKQLDLLREINKHLRDERDISSMVSVQFLFDTVHLFVQGPVEDAVGLRECIFKVIFVGNSSVGKTALLRRFCDGRFHPTMVTVGIDYCMHSLNLGDSLVRLQLWDTAGQERYRSITQQFFRKADGVVVIYDVTTHDSFSSVHCWLDSIEEEVRGPIPIMLLGNKSDKEIMREVPTKVGEQLAQVVLGTFSSDNIHPLIKVMREQEDRVWESTVLLVDKPMKRKACCN